MSELHLRPVSASRPDADGLDDYDVIGPDGLTIGRIFKATSSPAETPWMWTLEYGEYEYGSPNRGYESTREAAMQAFARNWRGVFLEMPTSFDDRIYFDHVEDVLASLDLVALLAPLVDEQPQYWKWLIVGAHSALQGAMVCALADSSNTSILTLNSRRKMLQWFDADPTTRGEFPKERLAEFGDLLKLALRGSQDCPPLALTRQQCRDIRRLHREFRNTFTHFVPMGWWIEKEGLPRIIGAALCAVKALMSRIQTRLEDAQLERLNKALNSVTLTLR